MVKTKRSMAASAMAIILALTPAISIAKSEDLSVLPEKDGVYDVPGRPDLKLRVFVHPPKGNAAKPVVPAPAAPVLICAPTETADVQSDAVVSAAGWKLPLEWNYKINLSSVPSTVTANSARTAADMISDAYGAWQSVLGDNVSFVNTGTTGKIAAKLDGQNIVAWGRASNTALAVTYTWYNAATGAVNEIDTIMNSRFTWYWSDPLTWPAGQTCAYQGVYDAQNILTHELGHTVGLDDEYDATSYGNNTMYGYGSTAETKKNTLTNGDILGAQKVYGLAE